MSDKVFTINGASDDLIEAGLDGRVTTEYDAPKGKWEGILRSPSGAVMLVHFKFTRDGTWMAGVSQFSEELLLPSWPVSISQAPGCAYAAMLTVTAPEGTTLNEVQS